jgi:hypothetical protein
MTISKSSNEAFNGFSASGGRFYFTLIKPHIITIFTEKYKLNINSDTEYFAIKSDKNGGSIIYENRKSSKF